MHYIEAEKKENLCLVVEFLSVDRISVCSQNSMEAEK